MSIRVLPGADLPRARYLPSRFHESLGDWARRIALGIAYALRGPRIRGVPALLGFTARRLLTGDRRLPQASDGLERPTASAVSFRTSSPRPCSRRMRAAFIRSRMWGR